MYSLGFPPLWPLEVSAPCSFTYFPFPNRSLSLQAPAYWHLLQVLGTYYVDVVGHDNDEGLKVTDLQRLTMSSLKEMELRS